MAIPLVEYDISWSIFSDFRKSDETASLLPL